jgi:hypothetical protein
MLFVRGIHELHNKKRNLKPFEKPLSEWLMINITSMQVGQQLEDEDKIRVQTQMELIWKNFLIDLKLCEQISEIIDMA